MSDPVIKAGTIAADDGVDAVKLACNIIFSSIDFARSLITDLQSKGVLPASVLAAASPSEAQAGTEAGLRAFSPALVKAAVLALAPATDLSAYATTAAVNSAITAAVNGLLNGAGPAYDTLKELQDLITSDETSLASLLTAVNARVRTSDLDTDETLAANSDSKVATQKAVKAFVAASLSGPGGGGGGTPIWNAAGYVNRIASNGDSIPDASPTPITVDIASWAPNDEDIVQIICDDASGNTVVNSIVYVDTDGSPTGAGQGNVSWVNGNIADLAAALSSCFGQGLIGGAVLSASGTVLTLTADPSIMGAPSQMRLIVGQSGFFNQSSNGANGSAGTTNGQSEVELVAAVAGKTHKILDALVNIPASVWSNCDVILANKDGNGSYYGIAKIPLAALATGTPQVCRLGDLVNFPLVNFDAYNYVSQAGMSIVLLTQNGGYKTNETTGEAVQVKLFGYTE